MDEIYTDEIYTDGSCLKNPGPGGWAVCIKKNDGNEYCFSGGEQATTNNRMELKAVIEAISHIKTRSECNIYTDSQLVINCATGKWKRKANLDLWEEFAQQSKNKKINFNWVKGHSGNKYNEMVDKLALAAAHIQKANTENVPVTKNFIKTIHYKNNTKKKDAKLEIELQNIAASYEFTPKIYNTKFEKQKCTIEMENLQEMCLADKYGEKAKDIPEYFWDQIRNIIEILYTECNIEYIDITPYNFIEKDRKIYIIDFGHAYYSNKDGCVDYFFNKFLNGHNGWNPEFK